MSVENNTWVKYRPKPAIIWLFKILVGLVLIWFLYSKISTAISKTDVLNLNYSSRGLGYFLLAFALTFFNWFFEARKWQLLTSPFESLSLKIAYKSVLSGLATGLLTPNRLGNFMGRLIYLKPRNRLQGTINTQLGNLAQFIISISLGLVGLIISLSFLKPELNPWVYGILPLGMLVLAISIYFKPKIILKLPFGYQVYKRNTKDIDDLVAFPSLVKRQTLARSASRYFIFLVQYYLLFKAFLVDEKMIVLMALAATTFLITTVIPGVFMGKLLVRESVAVFVFSWIAMPIQTILAVSFLLWLINLAIPSIFGWVFWLKKSAK